MTTRQIDLFFNLRMDRERSGRRARIQDTNAGYAGGKHYRELMRDLG